MARVLSDESSLARQKARLAGEERLLKVVHPVLFAVAGLLLLAGAAVFFATGSRALLIFGGVAAFVALGQFMKARENRRQQGIVAAGRKGEVEVNKVLQQALSNDYYIFNDLTLKYGRHTAQLDHVVVSANGIFVIETKNWSGHIEGDENEDTWLQVKQRAPAPIRVRNPLRQNQRHVEALRAALGGVGIDWPDVQPILVFVSRWTTFEIQNQTGPILRAGELGDYIASFRPSRTYSEAEVDRVLNHFMKAA